MPSMEVLSNMEDTLDVLRHMHMSLITKEGNTFFSEELMLYTSEKPFVELYRAIEPLLSPHNACIYPEELSRIIAKAIKDNSIAAIAIINSSNNVADIFSYAHVLMNSNLILPEYWMLFDNFLLECELLRRFFLAYRHNGDVGAEIVNALVRLANRKLDAFQVLLGKLQHIESFVKAIPLILNSANTDARLCFANHMPLRSLTDGRTFQLEQKVSQQIEDEVYHVISNTICDRYEAFIKLEKHKDKFHNSIVIFSYIDVVINCLCYRYQNARDRYQTDLNSLLEELEQTLFSWYSSSSHFTTAYFVDITRLNLMNCVNSAFSLVSKKDRPLFEDRLRYLKSIAFQHKHCWNLAEHSDFKVNSTEALSFLNMLD